MNKDWILTVIFITSGFLFLIFSIESGYLEIISDFIKRLIEPITVGILP